MFEIYALRVKRSSCIFLLFLGIAGGYFWVVASSLKVSLPSAGQPIVFYSNQKRQDLKITICEAIKQAKQSILIHIYGLTDPDIVSLLKEKKGNGVDITIFYDEKASPHLQSEFEGKIAVFPIRSSGLMHLKILIIDERMVLVGTANFTPQSLRMHDNLIVGFDCPLLAVHLKHCKTAEFFLKLKGQKVEVYLLPDFEKKALHRLMELIENAKKSLSIAMFTLTHPLLTEKLIEAQRRGVEVKVAVDFFTGHGSSESTLEKLQQAGVKVSLSQGDALLHHKWAWIDQTTLVIGSANWTQAAFKNNQDCFFVLSDLKEEHQRFMNGLWEIMEADSCPHSNNLLH